MLIDFPVDFCIEFQRSIPSFLPFSFFYPVVLLFPKYGNLMQIYGCLTLAQVRVREKNEWWIIISSRDLFLNFIWTTFLSLFLLLFALYGIPFRLCKWNSVRSCIKCQDKCAFCPLSKQTISPAIDLCPKLKSTIVNSERLRIIYWASTSYCPQCSVAHRPLGNS